MDHSQTHRPDICPCYALLCCVASWDLLALSEPLMVRSWDYVLGSQKGRL